MRQPINLTVKLARYIAGKKISRTSHYPIVLMLEPLHTCNLACIGCTPDRWAGPKSEWLTLAQCLESVDECDAPIVSICGGEPLVYPELPELVNKINARGKFTIVCTNALLMDRYLKKQKPNKYQSFAIHIDGPEEIHDHITKHPGCFRKAVDASKRAKDEGYRVTTNTTVFAETDIDDLIKLFHYLKRDVGVDSLLVSPGYDFDQTGDDLFLRKQQAQERFRRIFSECPSSWFGNSELYLEFLQGKQQLTCTAWGNPTRTPKGWQGPCYMLRDAYHETWGNLVRDTDWSRYGPESDDPRCQNCMVHCGFEPTVATGRGVSIKQQMRNAVLSLV